MKNLLSPDLPTIPQEQDGLEKTGFAAALTEWYHAGHRDLPWRKTNDPYAIWLSEVMLQQTQVRTVLDYYRRFLERYPTIANLAAAPIDDVLKQWEGLGYYARGRNLHKAAQQIVEHHGGQFPNTLDAVEALPGIGRSTAGAILTFGYGQKHPLLDGNVKRVLSRIADISDPVDQTATLKMMWQLSAQLLEASEEPFTYNQAIMELGATICLPKEPRCMLCPVKKFCDAFAVGIQHERPIKGTPKAPTPHLNIGVGVIWKLDAAGGNAHQILIQQRPAEGLLGGLWEFPGGKQEPGEGIKETVQREIQEELGLTVAVADEIMAVKHAYTHFKITLHAFHCLYKGGDVKPESGQAWHWVPPEKLPEYAFPKANKTVLQRILADWQQTGKAPDFP